MKSSLGKDIARDIKNSLGRFISIVAIVAIGVALFAGVKVSSPVMKINADKYYDEQNFMDIQLVSNFGLTKEDVESIRNLKGIEGVFPTYSMDVLTTFNAREIVLKVHGMDFKHMEKDDKNYINRPLLVKGRFPEKEDECVIESELLNIYNYKIGDVIQVESGKSDSISDSLKTNKFTIVGTVQSPTYVSFEKGSSSIGNGSVNGFIIISNDTFKLDVYTEILLTVNGSKKLQTYNNKYDEVVGIISDKLEAVGVERSKIRGLEIIAEAKDKIAKSKDELQNAKNKTKAELDKAKEELESAENQIALGQSELISKEENYKATISGAEGQIAEAENEIKAGEETYNKEHEAFLVTKADAELKIKEAEEQITMGEDAVEQLEGYIVTLRSELDKENLTDEEKKLIEEKIVQLEGVIEDVKNGLVNARQELESQKALLVSGEQQLAEAKGKIDSGKAELEIKKATLEKEKILAESQFSEGRDKLNASMSQLSSGEDKYLESKAQAEKKILDGENNIADAEYDLNNLDTPKWYVLDRNTNYSYVDYENSANSIDAIAQVFPVFFFVVAALVCLTTMTRMVDEQRGIIGTLKALGYSKGAIVSKYVIYAVSASLLGSVIGILVGFTLFPTVIFNAYGIMYELPAVTLSFNWTYAVLSTLAAILVTSGSALIACYKELVETPALLMRPKAPAMGKRILLERMPFIWNRFSFLTKVCARNIFRYKKRFLMTVIGVAGCTALLLTGYGIRDSIKAIVERQFGQLYHYDMSINLEENMRSETYDKIISNIADEEDISEYMIADNLKINVSNEAIKKEVTLFIPKDLSKFKDFITLRKRNSKTSIELSDQGVILNEKLAKQLGVSEGDKILIDNGDKDNPTTHEVIVKGITEHYVYHYIYMTETLYEKIYGKSPQFSNVLAKINDKSKEGENKLATSLISNEEVISVNFNTGIKESYNDMIQSLNYVVIVMIASAGALAFVVLYNLTNVNISERIREIATIKVLGFYDKEVSAYIYKEITLLTFIGMIVGLGLGVILHRYIMVTVELDAIMFGRNINLFSYIWAAALTMIFGAVVNFVMYFKLRNITMVESLKSID